MKKRKTPLPITTPAVETFGGDYHKCESTFQPRRPASAAAEANKRKAPAADGHRKAPRA